MAARFCKRCHINWPVSEESCKRCGEPTQSFAWRMPDATTPDEEPIELDEEYLRILDWRAAQFREQGVDPDTSYTLASERNPLGGFEVDIGRFRALRSKGWTAEQAVKVLG